MSSDTAGRASAVEKVRRGLDHRVEVHSTVETALALAGTIALAGFVGGYVFGLDDEPAASGAAAAEPVALTDPTSCDLGHEGDPTAPDVLTLDCADAAWQAPGPWVDREQRDFAATDRGWVLTQGVVVGGEARLWFRGEDLKCLATRDLLDTAAATRVRCEQVEPAAPLPRPEPQTTTIPA